MAKEQTSSRRSVRTRLKEPSMYRVIMHNDDVTTMEFVVSVLKTVFRKDQPTAKRLMLAIHQEGSAIVGRYTLDIAASKVEQAQRMAQQEGYPLKVTYEEDN